MTDFLGGEAFEVLFTLGVLAIGFIAILAPRYGANPQHTTKGFDMKAGDIVKMPAGKAKVTRIENGRVFFRYIRNGKPSSVERNVTATK